MAAKRKQNSRDERKGKLRIGDEWNAISIIALSQNNPLKAVAEFVENSIDANAKHISIIRGKEHGAQFLKIIDDGEGIPKNAEGMPDFKYVATHICDSIKKRLKEEGFKGIQGEFGIGLLSFWTVGEQLQLVSSDHEGKNHVMEMVKGQPGYSIAPKRTLVPTKGTELLIHPLLSGVRQISGEKIQRYLASELRDRIRKAHVQVKVIDRLARKEYKVEPRQFSGQLLHQLEIAPVAEGEIYLELYLAQPEPGNQVGLYRQGTRVLESLTRLDRFQQPPWTSGYLTGLIDASFLNLTPGTRDGIIQDDNFGSLAKALEQIEIQLLAILQEQQQAEEEQSARQVLRSVQSAFRQAFQLLPQEEYDWFDVQGAGRKAAVGSVAPSEAEVEEAPMEGDRESKEDKPACKQKQFFEFPGPLHKAAISPASSILPINSSRTYRAVAKDRSGKVVENGLNFKWQILEGSGSLDQADQEMTTFTSEGDPGLVRLQVTIRQAEIERQAEAVITVTGELFEKLGENASTKKGLPAYTFVSALGELWRSRYDREKNIIEINKGHRDFRFAGQNKIRKLRYICRLFSKELVLDNFPGLTAAQLLEHMVELSMYAEEHL